jgi:FAD:protein FMN transferase
LKYLAKYELPYMKKNILFFFFILVFGYAKSQTINIKGIATGSPYTITYVAVDNEDYKKSIDSLLKQVDNNFSLYDNNSLLSKLNSQNNSETELSKDFIELFHKSEEISKKTDGAFDITVLPLITLWKQRFKSGILADSLAIDSVKKIIGYKKISLQGRKLHKKDKRIILDFNAIAQGYAVDKIRKFLFSKKINNYIIDVGGEVFANGIRPNGYPWIVGIEKPTKTATDEKEILFTVPLFNKAIATSGNYRKYTEIGGKRYSHIINPFSGFPLNDNLVSVSVVANDCSTADGFATAFMVLGITASEKIIKENPSISACFVYFDEDGILKTKKTKDFPSHTWMKKN